MGKPSDTGMFSNILYYKRRLIDKTSRSNRLDIHMYVCNSQTARKMSNCKEKNCLTGFVRFIPLFNPRCCRPTDKTQQEIKSASCLFLEHQSLLMLSWLISG